MVRRPVGTIMWETMFHRFRLLAAGLALIFSLGVVYVGASAATSARVSAHLTSRSFHAAQARSVQVVYRFSSKSTWFAYVLSRKAGSAWSTVRSVSKRGSFRGSHTMTVKSVFGSKQISAGQYRLRLSSSANGVTLSFTVVPSPAVPQPFNVSGFLNGDAKPTLPAGAANKVAVIAQAPLDKTMGLGSATLTFAFRNNTDKAISHVDWTATARTGGKLVATGSSQGTQPAQIAPGEVGMAFIYFEAGEGIPDNGATYQFSAKTSEANTDSYNTAPLVVGEANRNGMKIVGSGTNKTGKPLTGPYRAEVYCFDGNNITGERGDFAEEDGDVQPNGTVHFTVDLADTPCKTFAVGVSGYFS